ncbi:RagB/SusD family nutrient uptake outer membrane protein [Maribellus luteus]|nr:RagB/SusD family nutrient uptake outer membrane protein [Maribellus luteus]
MRSIYFALIGLFFFASCSEDILEVESSTQISSETFWRTESDVRLAIDGTYSTLGDLEQNYIYHDVMSDNAYNNYPWEGFKAIADGTHTDSDPWAISGFWEYCFRGIGRANVVLDNLDDVEGLNDDFKKSVRGEALFLRAYFYFKLTDHYGGVPIFLESPKLEHGQMPRDTKENVVKQILIDLDEAASLLPATQSQTGRATVGAAKALKTRVLLYNGRWAEAATTAKEVLNMNYSLFPSYRELFMEANENNQEVIFDVQFKAPEQGNFNILYLGSFSIGGWSSIVPMQSLVDEYEMTDGLSIEESPMYDAGHPYNNRDPRLKATIFVPGVTANGIPDHEGEYTGYTFKKYTEYNEDNVVPVVGYPNTTGTNTIVFRYGQILLAYAEAQNEAVGPDQSVYDAVNAVRTRPGVEMPALQTGMSKDEMRQAIRHERRVELALEGTRYSDLKRWKIAEDVLDGLVDPGGTRVFDPSKHYLWPIPRAEFDIEGTQQEQNPGW